MITDSTTSHLIEKAMICIISEADERIQIDIYASSAFNFMLHFKYMLYCGAIEAGRNAENYLQVLSELSKLAYVHALECGGERAGTDAAAHRSCTSNMHTWLS